MTTGAAAPAAAAAAAAPAKGKGPVKGKVADDDDEDEEEGDDDGGLFDDDDDDEDAAAAAKAKAAAAAGAKGEKKKRVEKTSILWEVKPADDEVDLAEIERRIRGIEMEGLVWGMEFKREPVAFGIFKLVVQAIVEDDKVGADDIEEQIQSWEDIVSSIDQLGMQKIG